MDISLPNEMPCKVAYPDMLPARKLSESAKQAGEACTMARSMQRTVPGSRTIALKNVCISMRACLIVVLQNAAKALPV